MPNASEKMITLNAHAPDFWSTLKAHTAKRQPHEGGVTEHVRRIISDVRQHGNAAVIRYTEQFDKITPNLRGLDPDTIKTLGEQTPDTVRAALHFAKDRITAFHALQRPSPIDHTDAQQVRMGMQWTAVDSCGLYVPGGQASYPSSVLMNAIPAQVAGVKRLAVVTPTPNGQSNPAVFYALSLLHIEEVYTIGGAQAIAALAYGTETIKAVDKIVGPGNAFVAEAKRQVYGTVGIDSIAGPSEVVILVDSQTPPEWTAWDLLAQAEHDAAAMSILITNDPNYGQAVTEQITQLLPRLKNHALATASIRDFGAVIVVRDWSEAWPIVNHLAPEHLQIALDNPRGYLPHIRHAGSIFLGKHTPEAVGDYVGGPNHVLPTMGNARFASGLSCYDFLKRTTLLECSERSLHTLGSSVIALADSEGLTAHRESVRTRLKDA
jgi:histidinol dehydrogenase